MIDALGHPITEGSIVLTPGYWSPTVNEIVKVKKVTACYVHVELSTQQWDNITTTYVQKTKLLKRRAHQVVVVDKQLKYNRKTYPELMI